MTSEQMQQEIWQLKQALMEERLAIGGVIEDRNQIATRLAAAEKVVEAAKMAEAFIVGEYACDNDEGWLIPDGTARKLHDKICEALASFDAAKEGK